LSTVYHNGAGQFVCRHPYGRSSVFVRNLNDSHEIGREPVFVRNLKDSHQINDVLETRTTELSGGVFWHSAQRHGACGDASPALPHGQLLSAHMISNVSSCVRCSHFPGRRPSQCVPLHCNKVLEREHCLGRPGRTRSMCMRSSRAYQAHAVATQISTVTQTATALT
jgi:hypothetical protein